MAASRKHDDVVGYVHSVSPRKKNKWFNLKIQTEESNGKPVKAICFDAKKYEKLESARLSGIVTFSF